MIADEVLYVVSVVDVAATARRLYGTEGAAAVFGRPLPAHDYRFDITYDDGKVTFGRDATVADVIAFLRREKLLKDDK